MEPARTAVILSVCSSAHRKSPLQSIGRGLRRQHSIIYSVVYRRRIPCLESTSQALLLCTYLIDSTDAKH